MLKGLRQVLREEGYAVDSAADGQDGLSKVLSWDYDAVVLDLMLSKMSGLDVLKTFRKQKATLVLILTARDTVQDRVEGLDTGADDYLVKPFQLDELKARLRALIRCSVGQATPTVEVGSLLNHMAARRVSRDGTPVSLTAREYGLVELLVLHRHQVVTRTMIYDHLFDESHDSLSNMVDVYISRLRAKLGKDFVTTRRGEGYIVDV